MSCPHAPASARQERTFRTFRISPAVTPTQEKICPGLARPVAVPGRWVLSSVPNLSPTQHVNIALHASKRRQEEIKTKKHPGKIYALAETTTFFFRSRDRLRCFLFFSVSSSALISKSLVFFNCEAAWAIMHLKRSSQARRASSAKVICSGTFSQAYSSIPITGEEPLTRSRKACKMQKKML